MPFDGVVAKSVTEELSEKITGGRIEKIFQPEADEIILNIRARSRSLKLLLSANAGYPRIHITEALKENPSNPPVFCMLLRKHLSGGKITGIGFHNFERIVAVEVESTNELGDVAVKKLIIEIMGRHSNIILINDENRIIDSIKHVDNEISSVREVMPARMYVPPPAQNKTSPEFLDADSFIYNAASSSSVSVEKYLLDNIKGFSPLLCREVCFRSGIDGKTPVSNLSADTSEILKKTLKELIVKIVNNNFIPCIIFNGEETGSPLDYHCIEIKQYNNVKYLSSISDVLDTFYSEKDRVERLKQKKSGITRVLNNSIDRCDKKLALQQDKLREVSDREKLKLYGELITANIYCIPKNMKKITLLNYRSEKEEYLEIPLDENLSPQENAQKYFRQYVKAKSAFVNTGKQVEETNRELEYLESVLFLLENCASLREIDEIRQELAEQGYLSAKRKGLSKADVKVSLPFHYKSTDGFEIYAGKNNRQNDLLTLKSSASNDIWLHTRNIPGSHIIIKKGRGDVPGNTLFEAAVIAAFHSKARFSSNVPVDYTSVRNVKKPPGAKPGMVIYDNFKTITVTPEESVVKKLLII